MVRKEVSCLGAFVRSNIAIANHTGKVRAPFAESQSKMKLLGDREEQKWLDMARIEPAFLAANNLH